MSGAAENDNGAAGLREWWTAAEIAGLGLPGVPETKQGVICMIERVGGNDAAREFTAAQPLGIWRRRKGRGGGREYRMDVLPTDARAALALRLQRAAATDAPDKATRRQRASADLWAWFDALPDKRKAEAKRRLDALLAVEALQRAGRGGRDVAMMDIAVREQVSLRTLYGWLNLVAGRDRADWLPALAPRHAGRTAEAEMPAEAWAVFASDYLRAEAPTSTACYRRLEAIGKARGWTLPSRKTFERRIDAMPKTVVVLAREGIEALKRLYPAQERDRSMFHALEAVNADGHKWDVFVKWPDGKVSRPVMVGFQDLYSGMILSYRIARTEDTATVLAAFGDLVEAYGIPEHCWLDNGRSFASKWFTGGTENRFRFKVRPQDPVGVLTALGVTVHWTTPYHGQSKPIERAWRDFATDLAKHPACAGAYTGNKPDAKPENYAASAVPIDDFVRVVAEGVIEHNARAGRRSRVCGGRLSFAAAFAASYADAIIRRATAEQRRLWLLAAEGVSVRQDGSVALEGNRYWHERLTDLIGHKVVVRFDPGNLHAGVSVYRLDGAHVVDAPVIEAVGFADTASAAAHARARTAFARAQKDLLAATRTLTPEELVAMAPPPDAPAALPDPRAVRLVTGRGALALAAQPAADADTDPEIDSFGRGVRMLRLVGQGAVDE